MIANAAADYGNVLEFPAKDTSQGKVSEILSSLDDAQLAALEDELDFCVFAGLPSQQILSIMDQLGELDESWRNMLDSNFTADIPAAAKLA